MDVDDDGDVVELSSDAVILLLKQSATAPSAVDRLAEIAASGELRDFDELFADALFYKLSASLLTSCWHEYDVHHALSSDSQHELFVLQHEQRRQREESGMDDEEDEEGDAIGSQQQQDASWSKLQHAYTFVSHLLNAPECDPSLAQQRHAFDGKFLAALMERIQPKRRKNAPPASHQPLHNPTKEQLQGIIGVGSVSMGTAAQMQTPHPRLANVPQSILSTVGVGIRAADPDSPTPQELSLLRGLLHRLYALLVPQRPLLLSLMASFFQRFLRQPIFPQGVGDLLAVYASIVKGLRLPLLPRHVQWLLHNVLPLHLPNAMQTELTPLIQSYHEPLVYVLCEFLKKDSTLSTLLSILTHVLMAWPTPQQPNSAKEVLLLHEMEKLLEFCSLDVFGQFAPSFFPYLVSALASSHHRVSERCLQLWQNDKWLSLINSQRETLFPLLMPVLLTEKHWNKSVNKMRVVVLETCQQQCPPLFAQCVHGLFQLDSPAQSLARAEALMAEMRPAEPPPSLEAQLLQTQAVVPSSLPSVAYNEFVFGHLLGEGSFSQVRYAKRIVKGASASQWPEYAVKVIDRELIRQQQYEANVEREKQIMSCFHHPNVTSLIATCSNDHHLYFVLEYAAKGDLHTHLSSLGSFSVPTTRFIAAEIVRGLEHIHAQRVVWGDCKPENVLVHQSGHVKMTDFGSSRKEEDVVAGGRVEGTEDYLAPELLQAGRISQASDLWAFGCVVYQMLEGKTPMALRENAPGGSTKRRRPKPPQDPSSTSTSSSPPKSVHFDPVDLFHDSFDADAKALISSILVHDARSRFAVLDDGGVLRVDYDRLKAHPFFTGIEWDRLHTLPAPTLAGGSVAPAPDAKWARRKNSLMWAPMPKAYAFTDSQLVMETILEDDGERGDTDRTKPAEGGEAGRMKYVGFKADASMSKVEEAEEEEEEDEQADEPDLLLNGYRQRRLDEDPEQKNGEATSTSPARLSSRATASTTRDLHAPEAAPAPPPPASHRSATSSSAALPPRPRIAIRSAPPPAARGLPATSFVPDASPLSGVRMPGINGGLGQRPLGNPTAASLLNRVLGKGTGEAGQDNSK